MIVKAGMPKLMPNTTSGVLQFSTEEGLPGIAITASLVDKYGSTWLATEKGLCRYTGEYLYIYSFLNKNPQGSDYTITHMAMDNDGNIWIATGGDGIYVINTNENILLHNVSDIYYTCILSDHTGMIWVTTFLEGLFIIDPQKKTVKNIRKVKESNYLNAVGTITEDRNKNIWLGYLDHIAIVDAERKQIKNM